MRKFLVFVILIAAMCGGYSAYWYKKANDFKQMFAQSVDAFNQQNKPLTKDLSLVRYSSVEITGFPFAMVLEVNKPILDIPVSTLIREMPAYKDKLAGTPAPFEWVEEISYGEKITVTGNAMGDYFTLTTNGDRINTSLVNGAPRHAFITTSSMPVCHLGVQHPKGALPWTMQPLFTDLPTFFSVFRSFDCDIKNIAMKDKTSGTELLTAQSLNYSLTNVVEDPINHKLSFSLDAPNGQATPAFDTIVNDYRLMMYTLMGTPDAATPYPISETGKQDVKMAATYEGPTDTDHLKDPTMHAHVDLNSFEIHNALFNVSATLHLADTVQGTDRLIAFAFHSKSNATARYDEISQKNLVAVLRQMSQDNTTKDIAQKLAAAGTPEAIAAKIYPQMHDLGDFAIDVDFNMKAPNQAGAIAKHNTIALDDFNILTTPYGVKIKGTAVLNTPEKEPNVDISLTCISCNALVDDLGGYAMRVESVADQFNAQPAQPASSPFIKKDLIEGVKQFLHGIAESSAGNDLVIHVVMKDTGTFTISGKQLPEVMGVYMTTIVPHLPQQQPQTPPPAPIAPPPAAPKKTSNKHS